MTVATQEREVAKIVAGILMEELGLDEKHVLLGDQQYDLPTDKGLFAIVFTSAAPPIGATSFLDNDETSSTFGKEVQQASVLHDCRVEVFSFDQSARTRAVEVVMALVGFYAQQQAERYRVQIGRPSNPVDASETETTKRLLKYVCHVKITALHQKVKNLPGYGYFDKFNGATADASAKSPSIATQD